MGSLPPTVLKTAFQTSTAVRLRPLKMNVVLRYSVNVRGYSPASASLAVSLAVTWICTIVLSLLLADHHQASRKRPRK